MQPSGDHEVQHQPEIIVETNCNALADTPQFAHHVTLGAADRRLRSAQQKRAGNPRLLEGLTDDAPLKCADVGRYVGQLRHRVSAYPKRQG